MKHQVPPERIILTSFVRHPLNSCGAHAPHSPEPVEGFVPLDLHLHNHPPRISPLSPRLGNPMGHVRLEARRMKLPALAACRACATGCLHVAAVLRWATLDSFARRVACIRLSSRVPISWEVAFEEGKKEE